MCSGLKALARIRRYPLGESCTKIFAVQGILG